jgi:hypothetical protein
MKTFNVVANVATFNSGTEDSNGLAPVIFRPVAGGIPRNAMVIAGTIAKNEGFEPGNNYLLQVRELEEKHPEYGTQYRHSNFGKLSPMELMSADVKAMGAPKVLTVAEQEEEAETADALNEGATA